MILKGFVNILGRILAGSLARTLLGPFSCGAAAAQTPSFLFNIRNSKELIRVRRFL